MIANANLAIEELEEGIRRELDRKYAFYRMLHATDRVLWRLEELNRDGVKRIAAGEWERMRTTLGELPEEALGALATSTRVQELLDGVFACQDVLLTEYVPGHERETGADPDDEPEGWPAGDVDELTAVVEHVRATDRLMPARRGGRT